MSDFAPLPPRLLAAIERVAAALPEATSGSHIAMAFDRDRFAFAAAVLAAWSRGHAVALPRNARREHVMPVLARTEVVLLAHDTGAGLGLDVPLLLEPMDGPRAKAPVRLTGTVTIHDGDTTLRLTPDDLWTVLTETAAIMALPRGARVCNVFSAGAPCALVPGVLVPFLTGCPLVTSLDDAHTAVAPVAVLRRIARTPGPVPEQVVAPDGLLDAPTVAAFAARGVRVLAQPFLDLRPRTCHDVEDAVLAVSRVDDAAAEAIADDVCCIVATPRSEVDVHRSAGIPSHWPLRCLPSLPRDADGHVDRATVLRLSGRQPDGQLTARTLDIVASPNDGTTHTFRTTLPTTFFAFDGHFATYPVLSGAMQLHEVVMPCARLALGANVQPAAFHDLKFLARIAPGDSIDVTIATAPDGASFEFTITCRTTKCSAGRVALRAHERGTSS